VGKRDRVKDWRRWVLVALALWIVAVAWWAAKPMTDNVRTSVATATHAETVASVQCDSPLSGNTSPNAALPGLNAGQSFDRAPCELPINDGRIIFVIDVVVTVVVLFALIATRRHRTSTAKQRARRDQVSTLA